MGSTEHWRAVNADKTRKATEEIVWQNRAAHLREQGLLPPDAGPAEARAYDAEQKKAAEAAHRARQDAEADPKATLITGGVFTVLFVIGHVIARLADSSGWITATGWGIALAVGCTLVAVMVTGSASDRHERRTPPGGPS